MAFSNRFSKIWHRSIKTCLSALSCLSVLLFLTVQSQSAWADVAKRIDYRQIAEAQRTVELDWSSLSKQIGNQSLETLSLFAVKPSSRAKRGVDTSKQLQAIPYQVQSFNHDGEVVFHSDQQLSQHSSQKVGPIEQRLLFMFRDAGPRAAARLKPLDGQLVAEVALKLAGKVRYVYLVENSRLQPSQRYVRYSPELGQVHTDLYSLRVNRRNALIWDSFTFNPYTGSGEPIDTFKLRLNSGVVLPFIKSKLNNKHIVANLLAEEVGLVRGTASFKVNVKVMGVPLMRLNMQVHHGLAHLAYDVRMKIPTVRRSMLVKPSLYLYWDGWNLHGANIEAGGILGQSVEESGERQLLDVKAQKAGGKKERGGVLKGVVDGALSDVEVLMTVGDIADSNWLWLDSGQSMQWLIRFIPLSKQKDDRTRVHYYIGDDAEIEDKPERSPGLLPAVGYGIENFPASGEYNFRVELYLFSEPTGLDPKKLQAALFAPIEVLATSLLD